MKSVKDIFGLPAAFLICCLNDCSSTTVDNSSVTVIVSLPLELAGQKPTTPFAVNHFSSIIFLSNACASLYSFVASAPTFASVNMFGNFPCNSQAIKNGCQSI